MNYNALEYNRIIFVDTENVNESCIDDFDYLGEDDLVILMKSSHSFKIDIAYINKIKNFKGELKCINIHNGTANAMDFCLVSQLSYAMGLIKANMYVIISDDRGYVPVVRMWYPQGFPIKLFGRIKCLALDTKKNIIQREIMEQMLIEYDNKIKELKEKRIVADNKVEHNTEELVEVIANALFNPSDKSHDITEDKSENEIGDRLLAEQIKEMKKHSREKQNEKLKDLELEELENSLISDREYNERVLKKYVGEFGLTKKGILTHIIYNSATYEEAEESIMLSVKRNQIKIKASIRDNWDKFRHATEV